MTEQAFPLQWPAHLPRTPSHRRQRARFDTTPGKATQELRREIERAAGHRAAQLAVISTNIAIKRDGMPYARQTRIEEDPGAAVYFTRKGRRLAFACDRFDRVHDNLRAICKTIEAIRGIERWGAMEMADAAFTGFTALPPPMAARPWWEVLDVPRDATRQQVEEAYFRRARQMHPDAGGTDADMAALNAAREQASARRDTGG